MPVPRNTAVNREATPVISTFARHPGDNSLALHIQLAKLQGLKRQTLAALMPPEHGVNTTISGAMIFPDPAKHPQETDSVFTRSARI